VAATRYDDIAAIAYDTEHFSSRSIILATSGRRAGADRRVPPISSTRRSTTMRANCCSRRSPNRIDPWEPTTRAFCHSLIDEFGDGTSSTPPPNTRSASDTGHRRHAGLPAAGRAAVPQFVEDLLEGINRPPEERIERVGGLFDYLEAQVSDHLDPREDLTSYLINAELYGHRLEPAHVVGTMACC
jgi:hypothetical protein